jgi:hypothetical protein
MPERTRKQIAAGHRRRLQTIADKLRVMAAEWCDIDEVNIETLYSLGDQVEDTGKKLYTGDED